MIDTAKEHVGLIPQCEIGMLETWSQRSTFPLLQDLVVGNVEGMTADLLVHVIDLHLDVAQFSQ